MCAWAVGRISCEVNIKGRLRSLKQSTTRGSWPSSRLYLCDEPASFLQAYRQKARTVYSINHAMLFPSIFLRLLILRNPSESKPCYLVMHVLWRSTQSSETACNHLIFFIRAFAAKCSALGFSSASWLAHPI